jgi:DNA-binding transcriptional MerR regulator
VSTPPQRRNHAEDDRTWGTHVAWSTREIAELAGTSQRAVRHYHEVGLLAEPERRTNGYKQYGVAHLIRLLRITRLTNLGFSLSQIADLGDGDEHPEEALRTIDAELATTIERLNRVRRELGVILRRTTPTDLPNELAGAVDAGLTGADRAFVVVASRVLDPEGVQAYGNLLNDLPDDPVSSELDGLPADADEATRRDLAERLAGYLQALYTEHPALRDAAAHAPRGIHFASQTFGLAMKDLYNPAQIDVMRRANKTLGDQFSSG